MKKQINPTIKAHLIRSAFYVLLLLAVCVIPFALAQRNTTKRSAAAQKHVAQRLATMPAATGMPLSRALTKAPMSADVTRPGHASKPVVRPVNTASGGGGACNLGPWNIVAN